MKKFFAVTASVAMLALSLCGCSTGAVNKGIPEFEDNVIYRAAWWCPSPNEAEYTQYRDCGLNTVLLVNHNFWRIEGSDTLRDGYYLGTPPDYDGETMTDRSLALAKQMGLSVVVSNGDYLFSDDYSVYDEHTIHYDEYEDTIIGVFSGDEPSAEMFADRAAEIPKAEKVFPNVPYFCNLFPMYGDPATTLKAKSYTEYIDRYCEEFLAKTSEPRLLSVDFYPYISNASQQHRWLLNYRMLAERAEKYNADFHVFIQTAEGYLLSYDQLELEQVRQQVNVALAYGADAYSYYLYQPAIGGYHYGLVDLENKPSVYYDMAKTVNAEAASVEKALLHYDWVSTHPITDDHSDFGIGAFMMLQLDTREQLYEQSAVLTSAESDNRMLVTLLKDANGNEAFYVVNYFDAYDEEQFEDGTVTLTFDKMKQAAVYGTSERLNGQTVELEDGSFTYTLTPGDACLVIPYR